MISRIKLIVIIALLLFYFLGIGTGLLIGKKFLVSAKNDNNNFQAGWAAAKKRLIDLGIVPGLPAEVKMLSGTVEKIDGNTIKIKIIPLEPLADPILDHRTIYLSDKTVITKVFVKSDEQYTKELENLTKAEIEARGPDSSVGYVSRLLTEDASAQDIIAGNRLTIEAGEDIKEKSTITATKITIAQ